MDKRIKGTVGWYHAGKGYGFITGEDGAEYFVHQTQIRMDGFRKLKEHQKVSFAPDKKDDDRLVALDVEIEK